MPPVFDAIWQRADFWSLAALPVLAAILGWVGSRIALFMIFSPLEFVGQRSSRLGWQGIIPARAEHMAGNLVDHALMHATSLSECFRLMEPEKIAGHVSRSVLLQSDEYVDAIMAEKNAVFWDNLPTGLRQRVYARVRRQLPSIMDNLVDDMGQNIEELVDLRQMVVELLAGDPALLVRIYRELAAGDRRFIAAAGWRLCLLLGLAEVGLWLALPHHRWLLVCMPVAIGALGYILARRLLFASPHPLGAMLVAQDTSTDHPLLLADRFSVLVAEDLLSSSNVMRALMTGARAGRTRAMIKRHLRPLLDTGLVRTVIQLALGAEGYAYLKQAVVDRAVAMTMGSLADVDFNQQRAGQVHDFCRGRLAAMPTEEWRALLRPVFEEQGWVHVVVGAVLGLLVGGLQYGLLFANV